MHNWTEVSRAVNYQASHCPSLAPDQQPGPAPVRAPTHPPVHSQPDKRLAVTLQPGLALLCMPHPEVDHENVVAGREVLAQEGQNAAARDLRRAWPVLGGQGAQRRCTA